MSQDDDVAAAPGSSGLDPAPLPAGGDAASASGVSAGCLVGLVGLVAVSLLAAVGALVLAARSGGPETYRYVIPSGTAVRVARGEPVRVMPDEVQLKAGDHLVIENKDIQTHTIGPFSVRAGETIDKAFPERGRFVGACTVQNSEIRIVVT